MATKKKTAKKPSEKDLDLLRLLNICKDVSNSLRETGTASCMESIDLAEFTETVARKHGFRQDHCYADYK